MKTFAIFTTLLLSASFIHYGEGKTVKRYLPMGYGSPQEQSSSRVIQVQSLEELMKILNGLSAAGLGNAQVDFGGNNPFAGGGGNNPFGGGGNNPFGGGGNNPFGDINNVGGSAPASPSIGGGGDFRQAALQETNKYRRLHGAAPLVLDEQLNRESQAYAEELARTSTFKHSAANGYGENLFMMGGIVLDPSEMAVKAVKSWYDEVQKYDWNNPRFTSGVGHFTALVWKGSRKMGFGLATNPATRKTYVVARYVPPGNYQGQFPQNVGRPVG